MSTAAAEAIESTELSHRHILKFYAPLAISWIFMAIESPIALSVIDRMSNSEVNRAAFQPMMALAMLIESPVIDLLTTATTLGKDRQHYVQLSRFVWILMIAVTCVHAIVSATPLYWSVTEKLIGLPPEVAEAARPGLIVMIPWAAFIGWRRYLQGLLIRRGRTKPIGIGTAIRMVTMGIVAFGLYAFASLPGILTVACALLASVIAETTFIHFVSRQTVRMHLSSEEPELDPLTQRFLARFHLPLTATTIFTILSQPLVSTALARSPSPVLAMGAYQVASSIIWLHRTIVFALPEVVITLYKDASSGEKLKRFCLLVGLAATSTMIFVAATNLDSVIFVKLLKVDDQRTVHTAHLCLAMSCLLPLLGAMQAYLRGVLAAHHLTVSRLAAIFVALFCMIVGLATGVLAKWPGVVTASAAITLAQVAELIILTQAWRRGSPVAPG